MENTEFWIAAMMCQIQVYFLNKAGHRVRVTQNRNVWIYKQGPYPLPTHYTQNAGGSSPGTSLTSSIHNPERCSAYKRSASCNSPSQHNI